MASGSQPMAAPQLSPAMPRKTQKQQRRLTAALNSVTD